MKKCDEIFAYFDEYFSKIGIEIHNPKYGAWIDSQQHRKLSSEYNKKWETFFKNNPTYTEEQVMDYAKTIMNEMFGKQ